MIDWYDQESKMNFEQENLWYSQTESSNQRMI